MRLDDYRVVLYRNGPSGWVAEVPSIPGPDVGGVGLLRKILSDCAIEPEQLRELL